MRIPRSRVLPTPVPTRTGVLVLVLLVAAVLVGPARPAGAHGDEAVEPFLRSADGQVEANMASPTWHRVDGRSSSRVGEMRGGRTAPVNDDGGLPLLDVVLAMTGLVTIAAMLVVRRRSAKRVAAHQ